MTIFISPLIKGYDLFAIIEGYVFYILFVRFFKRKEENKNDNFYLSSHKRL